MLLLLILLDIQFLCISKIPKIWYANHTTPGPGSVNNTAIGCSCLINQQVTWNKLPTKQPNNVWNTEKQTEYKKLHLPIADAPWVNFTMSMMLSGRKMSMPFNSVTGIRPVPSDTTVETGTISAFRLTLCNAILYSCISVIASNVGLLAIRPPSRKSPNGRKYDGAAPVARAACQTNCLSGGGGGERRFSSTTTKITIRLNSIQFKYLFLTDW